MAKSSPNKKQLSTSPYQNLGLAVISCIAFYGFGSWAIDSGSIWHYVLMFASMYFAFVYFKKFFMEKFFKNDKSKATKAR